MLLNSTARSVILRKILADVTENKSSFNYLIQHSAGSGKTNTIAWLSHRFSSLHDKDDKQIFDNVVVVTDRVVVDRQLQAAISGIEHKSGLFKPMKDDCTSDDLRKALEGNTKIIATTIQKFPYIVDTVASLKGKTFAVIIDEAHSSTAGKNMAAITKALGKGKQNEDEEVDVEDSIVDEIKRNGKQENVSFFAFTATPKPTTLQLFGRINKDGHGEAFHTYSMKQAIEEGFILDVLQNYITYKTFYQVNKAIQDDPTLETKKAKRQIARTAELHDTNIAQRVEVIVEHFRTTVMQELDGNAKAMVIMKNETLKKSAASNNEKDFAFPFYDNIDDALIKGLDQNESFFSLLLNNDDIKKQVLGIFMGEIYKSLKKKAKETDVAGRIYKIPTQKNEFSEMPIAASEKQKNR